MAVPHAISLAPPFGRVPGFDPNHPASAGLVPFNGFSGIAIGANFVSLLTGKAGVVNTAPTNTILGGIGVGATFTNANDGTLFSGNATPSNNFTIAGIVQLNTNTGASQFILCPSGGSSTAFYCGTTWHLNASVSVGSGITPATGVPYFVICTFLSGTVVNFLQLNLNTGQILTSTTATAATFSNFSGNYGVGNSEFGGQPLLGTMSHVMYSGQYMTPAKMMAWAADPWSFWYPTFDPNFVGASSVTPPPPFLMPSQKILWM